MTPQIVESIILGVASLFVDTEPWNHTRLLLLGLVRMATNVLIVPPTHVLQSVDESINQPTIN